MDPIFATVTIFAMLLPTLVALVAIAYRQEDIAALAIKVFAKVFNSRFLRKDKDIEDNNEK